MSKRPVPLATKLGQSLHLRRAFTLVEMLVVMIIILLITSAAVPILRGILGARGVSNSVDAISGYLTNARIQAMSQNTFVVVGFYQAAGSDDLQMAAVRSLNGTLNTSNFPSTPTAANIATYQPLGPIVHLPNVTLTSYSGLVTSFQTKLSKASVTPTPLPQGNPPDALSLVIPDTPVNPSGSTTSMSFTFGSTKTNFNWYLIAFTPQGEALYLPTLPANATPASSIPYFSQLFIGVCPSRGGVAVKDYTAAAITVDGGSGSVNVYRL